MDAKVIEDVSSANVLQEKVDAMIILENVVHREDERVLGLEQDVLLGLRVQDLTLLNEDVLVDSLHGVLFLIMLVDHVEHLAKGSFVNDLDDLEVFEFNLGLLVDTVGNTSDQVLCGRYNMICGALTNN